RLPAMPSQFGHYSQQTMSDNFLFHRAKSNQGDVLGSPGENFRRVPWSIAHSKTGSSSPLATMKFSSSRRETQAAVGRNFK
ncbi:MAG TPA: hypothetical protein VK846_16175, partial [Candidatus Limnocylindria bacterium]|nr:hypothetical protein [Candidatus Limnocylindria bacterium]